MAGELLYKIIQRIEGVTGIEELLILMVAALGLSVVARRIGANQFMPDPQFGSRLLKQRRQSPRCIVVLHFQIIFLPVYDRFSLSGELDSVPPLIGGSNVLREAVIAISYSRWMEHVRSGGSRGGVYLRDLQYRAADAQHRVKAAPELLKRMDLFTMPCYNLK